MITFTAPQAQQVVAAARVIETSGPPLLLHAAWIASVGLRLVPLRHRRTVAAAIAELALRQACAPEPTPTNDRSPTA